MSLDVSLTVVRPVEVYEANITHNLNAMASKAGIYYALWRPEEVGIVAAKDLIKPLEEGLARLKENPERFRKFDASNGWGKYEDFVRFVEGYLEACKTYPDAIVTASR